jgi:transcriptional regulator with XRE-family HTH domain
MAADERVRLLAHRLREARGRAKLSQRLVAEVLGLSRPSVTNMERGARAVGALELASLARLYSVPVEELLRGL